MTPLLHCKNERNLEAAPGFEPGMKDLQSSALPLGYAATRGSIATLSGCVKEYLISDLHISCGIGSCKPVMACYHSGKSFEFYLLPLSAAGVIRRRDVASL